MSFAHCCDLFVLEREGSRGIWVEVGYKAKNIVGFNDQLIPPSFTERAVYNTGQAAALASFYQQGSLAYRQRERKER